MSFLAPWLVFAGVAAVGLPVLFHFFRRTPRGRMPFSTLMFLAPTPPRVTSRSKLENWPLLLLRAAVLVLLALAFGRPLWRELMESQTTEPAGARIVLLVDTSASLRRADLWSRAVAAAEQTAAAAGPHDELALVTFDGTARTLATFDAWRAAPPAERSALVKAALAATSPSWHATRLDEGLVAAADLLEATTHADKAGAPARTQRIVLVSDLQAGSQTARLQSYEWPKQVDVRVVAIAGPVTNAGLHAADVAATSAQADEPNLRPRVLITNAAGSEREQFTLAWQPLDPRRPLPAALAKPQDVYVPPGQSRIVRAPTLPPGDAAKLVLAGDDDSFDNTLWIVPPTRDRVRVLHLAQEKADDPQTLRYFLERAFADDSGRRMVVVETLDPYAAGIRTPTAADLEDVALVVVAHRQALPEAWSKSLGAWIDQGGVALGVPLMASDAGWRGVLPAELAKPAALRLAEGDRSREYALLSDVDLKHPLFAPLDDPRFSDFTKIRFWRHRTLKLDDEAARSLKVVAKFDSGDPAVLETTRGAGRVVLFAFGWQPRESQLGVSSKFIPLVNTLIDLGRHRPQFASSYEAGEPIDLADAAPGARPPPARTVVGPAGKESSLAADVKQFTPSDGPGLYELRSPAGVRRIAVNLPASESRTAPLAVEALEALGVRLAKGDAPATEQTLAAERTLQLEEMESRQQLWRPLLAAALLLIVVETWFAGRSARREAAAGGGGELATVKVEATS